MEEGYVESSHGMADRRGQSVDGTTGFRNKPLPSSVATSDNEKEKKEKEKRRRGKGRNASSGSPPIGVVHRQITTRPILFSQGSSTKVPLILF